MTNEKFTASEAMETLRVLPQFVECKSDEYASSLVPVDGLLHVFSGVVVSHNNPGNAYLSLRNISTPSLPGGRDAVQLQGDAITKYVLAMIGA